MITQKELVKWKPIYPLTGNGFYFGRIGSGKSFKLKATVEYYYEMGAKIWDMFGGKRGEGPFWCFKSDELELWREYEKEVGVMEKYGPKEFPVNLVYPFFKDTLPNELPEKKPNVSCSLMTIYFKDITIQDISYILGQVSPNAKYIWNYIIKNLPSESNGQDILNLFNKKFKKYKDLNLYKNFILPLVDAQILQGKGCKYNIDFVKEAKDKETIFVLCDDFTPQDFKFFIMGYIIRNLFDLVKHDLIPKPQITMFREMSAFMKIQDAGNQDNLQIQNFRNFICDIARYARSGCYIFGDTQSPAEVRGLIEGSEDLLCVSEMPSESDREAALEQMRKDKRISPAQIAYISMMPRSEMVVIERGKKAVRIRKVQPPKSACWNEKSGNFFTAWKKKENVYKDIREIKEEIDNSYAEAKFHTYEIDGEEVDMKNDEDDVEKEIEEEEVEVVEDEEETQGGVMVAQSPHAAQVSKFKSSPRDSNITTTKKSKIDEEMERLERELESSKNMELRA